MSKQLRQLIVDHFGSAKVPLASVLTKKEKLHVIQHLLAKMYMYILVIFMFHLDFVSFFKNNR